MSGIYCQLMVCILTVLIFTLQNCGRVYQLYLVYKMTR